MITKRAKAAGMAFTVILHLMLFVHFVPILPKSTPMPPSSKDEPEPISVKLIPMPTISKSDVEDHKQNDKPAPTYKTDPRVCMGKDKSYYGVGFIWNPGSQIITHAPVDYPAYKAGMRVGDMVLDPENPLINGYIDFNVIRSHQQIQFHVKADNICYQEG